MASRKDIKRQQEAESKILQYKAVVDYLSTKSDPAQIPVNNTLAISRILIEHGWQPKKNGLWSKETMVLNIVQAGKQEFQTQYDRLRQAHLVATVKNFKESKLPMALERRAKPIDP